MPINDDHIVAVMAEIPSNKVPNKNSKAVNSAKSDEKNKNGEATNVVHDFATSFTAEWVMFLSIMIHTYKFKTLTVTCLYYLLLCRDNIVDIDVHLTEFYEKELYEKIVEYLDKPLEDPIEESTEQTFTTKKGIFFFPWFAIGISRSIMWKSYVEKKNIHVRLDCKIYDKNKSIKELTN